MNIFAGFGMLGYVCLKEMISKGIVIDNVLTHEDGAEYSVDRLSKEYKIECHYSDLRKDQSLLGKLTEGKIKYLISVNYRYIFPKKLLMNSTYPLNLHGSLLPKYRGRTPHVWAIINGEEQVGVTCHVMEELVDTGDIYDQIVVDILPEDTGYDILKKYERVYPVCLAESLKKIEKGVKPVPQDNQNATYFGKRIPEMGYIDFTKDKRSLVNFIRAQSKPYPGAYCFLPDGKKLIIHKAVEFVNFESITLSLGVIFNYQNQICARVKDGYLAFTDFEIV